MSPITKTSHSASHCGHVSQHNMGGMFRSELREKLLFLIKINFNLTYFHAAKYHNFHRFLTRRLSFFFFITLINQTVSTANEVLSFFPLQFIYIDIIFATLVCFSACKYSTISNLTLLLSHFCYLTFVVHINSTKQFKKEQQN